MDRKSTVYVTVEDKEKLQQLISEIGVILEPYPYSNDYSDHFVTTMSRTKGAYEGLKHNIDLLDVR